MCSSCAYKASTEEGDEAVEAKKEAVKEARRLHQITRRADKKHTAAAEQALRGAIRKPPTVKPALRRATTSAASASRDTLLTKSAAQLAAEAQACIRHAQCTYPKDCKGGLSAGSQSLGPAGGTLTGCQMWFGRIRLTPSKRKLSSRHLVAPVYTQRTYSSRATAEPQENKGTGTQGLRST